MKLNEKVKELRLSFGLTQEQLGRAIFKEGATISQYESGKRNIDLDTLENIAEVFGYTVEFNLKEKKNKKEKGFYKQKSASDIMKLSDKDMVEYLFISGEDKIISKLCKLPLNIINTLPLEYIKNCIKKSIEEMDKEMLFDILNNTYNGHEIEMRDFIEYVNTHLLETSNISKELLDKVRFLEVDCRYELGRYDDGNYWAFYDIKLLDKDKKDLGVSRDDIDGEYLPLDNELDNVVGQYLERNSIIKINIY